MSYDGMHPFTQHYVGLRHAAAYLRALGARTILDTGCGTGLALRWLTDALPGTTVYGNDPSAELLRIAVDRHGVPATQLECVGSEELPYRDAQFDAVVETGMLHHVPDPDRIVREMLRVARLAVFISDTNMFGMGSVTSRIGKAGLRGMGALRHVNRWRRGGHDWYFSEEDGVAWDYSVFDSLATLRSACDEVVVIPTGPRERFASAVPLFCASHCLIVGLKSPLQDSWQTTDVPTSSVDAAASGGGLRAS
jgi:SAM-dependent methyltransferase